jgi:hypothetical protein
MAPPRTDPHDVDSPHPEVDHGEARQADIDRDRRSDRGRADRADTRRSGASRSTHTEAATPGDREIAGHQRHAPRRARTWRWCRRSGRNLGRARDRARPTTGRELLPADRRAAIAERRRPPRDPRAHPLAWSSHRPGRDLGAAVRATNRKVAEAAATWPDDRIATVWVVRASAANRALLARFPHIIDAAFLAPAAHGSGH